MASRKIIFHRRSIFRIRQETLYLLASAHNFEPPNIFIYINIASLSSVQDLLGRYFALRLPIFLKGNEWPRNLERCLVLNKSAQQECLCLTRVLSKSAQQECLCLTRVLSKSAQQECLCLTRVSLCLVLNALIKVL